MAAKTDNNYSPTPLHYLVFVLQHLSDELLSEEVGVGLSHARILGALDYKTPSSQKLVAAKLHQTEANVSRQLLAMSRQGLVKVTRNKADARQRDVTLTAKGNRRYEAAEKVLKAQLNTAYKGLNKTEKANFSSSVEKIISAF